MFYEFPRGTAAIAVADHSPSTRPPVRGRAGDLLVPDHERSAETDFKGWTWCRDGEGGEGWVPAAWTVEVAGMLRLQRDYSAFELTLNVGDRIVLQLSESGFVFGTNEQGDCGWVPDGILRLEAREGDPAPPGHAGAGPDAHRPDRNGPRASDDPVIRRADCADAKAVAQIYAHHVAAGTATFDHEPPDTAATAARIAASTARGWPFLVAETGGEVVGYADASQFRNRPAYAFACENSIYVHPDHLGRGIGRKLLSALVDAAEEAGFRQMVAVIGGGEPASVALHAAAGFREAGRMRSVGRKFGRWLDTVYMQRPLGAGDSIPPETEPLMPDGKGTP